jgi:hypothetical protein
MKSIMRQARLMAVLLAGLSVGLHWGLVQTVGWVSMTIEFSQRASLSEALEMTFDGEHPCRLCKLAQSQGHLPDGEAPVPSKSKMELKPLLATLWADSICVLTPLYSNVCWAGKSDRASRLASPPALPPPRGMV